MEWIKSKLINFSFALLKLIVLLPIALLVRLIQEFNSTLPELPKEVFIGTLVISGLFGFYLLSHIWGIIDKEKDTFIKNHLSNPDKYGPKGIAKDKDNLIDLDKELDNIKTIIGKTTKKLVSKAKRIKLIKNKENKKAVKREKLTNINALADDLTKLGELKDKGLLTEEEFNEQKKKLLKQ